tara:strand:+ start:239 stop:559 length:321 start_codon:yes stop_codon:yes gene_type:complete
VQQHTEWTPEGRELTIESFLGEVGQVVTEPVMEWLAEHDPKKLESMFLDWAKYRKRRTAEQRVNLLVMSVARTAPPVTFAFADAGGDKDLEPPSAGSNVVPLMSAR